MRVRFIALLNLAFGISLFLLSPSAWPAPSTAQKGILCANKSSGTLVVRTRCKRNETKFNISNMATFGAVGPTGPTGPAGAAGAKGETGATGERGLGILDTLPSGQTMKGQVLGVYYSAGASETWSASAAFPMRLPARLALSDVIISNNAAVNNACGGASCLVSTINSGLCAGDFTNPTAPAGKVCIYPSSVDNANHIYPFPFLVLNAQDTGFAITWTSNAGGESSFYGVWAYTAP